MKLETYATLALALWCLVAGIILADGFITALCR
jgi:hypothetical protein